MQLAITDAQASNEPLTVTFNDGHFALTSPLIIQPAPSAGIRFQAGNGQQPVLSGGIQLSNWTRVASAVSLLPKNACGQIWVTCLPTNKAGATNFRQLWVNGRKAVRASSDNGGHFFSLVAWDKTNQIATVPTVALTNIREPHGLEMIINQVWEIAVLRVKTIRALGTNTQITFQQPESRLEFVHPWPPVIVTTNYQATFRFENAMELLDTPGEWFLDVSAGKIYYWPRPSEDMRTAQVIVPVLETLVEIAGTLDQPATNICFEGITFAHTTWLRPAEQGHVPLQAGMFLLDAKKLSPKGTSYHSGLDNLAWIGRPPAAVMVKNAQGITFSNCTFEHLGAAGLDFLSGTRDDVIQGCTFHDIAGNGIQLGKFSDTNIETHLPYLPSDEREICTRGTIANNLIYDCGNEDSGCVGIAAGYVRNLSIQHNELFNLPYTGISVGWGWTKATNCMRDNLIHANHIHHVAQRLGDTAGIYTLSAQPGTVVSENYIHDIHISPLVPDTNHWFYLYLDEGSSHITVRDNWCPSEKFLKNANGPGNVWTNNGPQVSEKIKHAAGLEPAFRKPNADNHSD